MAAIEDIRINGQQTSMGNLIVAGLHPVFTWDYIEDAASESQVNFELLVATSNVNLGSDLFVGNVINVDRVSSTNLYEHFDHDLTRGTQYYGQLRASNIDGGMTLWLMFSFKLNRLPFVTSFFISPSLPSLNNDLDLNYTYIDPDGHNQAGTKIRWFKNNIYQARHDDLCILSASATGVGDSWHAKVVPSDGLEFGATIETQSVTVQDITAIFEFVTILPVDANVDDILKVEWALIENEYVQAPGVATIEWILNGTTVANSNKQFIRMKLSPGDVVSVIVKLADGIALLGQLQSADLTIADVRWYLFDLLISGLSIPNNLTDLSPVLEWNKHKTTSNANDKPTNLKVLITKTQSINGPIFDSGVVQYTKDSFPIPSGVLFRGQTYYVHVAASDSTEFPSDIFISTKVDMAGSSWSDSVDNAKGWTIEFKLSVNPGGDPVEEDVPEPNMGILIHDGAHFSAIRFGQRTITFLSDTTKEFVIPSVDSDLRTSRTFKIIGKGQDLRVFMNNTQILDVDDGVTNESKLKVLQYGDIDGKNANTGVFRFFRYSTDGAFGFGETLPDENTFLFNEVGKIEGGSIQYVFEDLLAWTPDDLSKSSKLITFNENNQLVRLSTVNRNFSPITAIHIDQKRNKYIGTANGLTVIFGERHEPDYFFDTSADDVQITPEDFDRISTVPASKLSAVEPDTRNDWFTLDTTYRAVGEDDPDTAVFTGDPYDPYIPGIQSHAIHYYTQRTHGHAWFDNVDNKKGWQISFNFDMDRLEADDFIDQNLIHDGFGVYINDGAYQEILYFYDDRIRLFYANVFVPIVTTRAREYVIVGKDNSIKIYQKLRTSPAGTHQLLLDASGLFVEPSTTAGNSRKPKIALDSNGFSHAVWHDDGNRRSQILYSMHDGLSWSNPEPVTETTQFNLRNPDIDVDSQGRIWIVYEDTSWGVTEIASSVKDGAGWNPRVRITNCKSDKGKPSVKIDAFDDVHVVWEDNRNGNWEILWGKWDNSSQAWLSSNFFAPDTVVMQFDKDDPYQTVVDFRNPQLAIVHPKLWLVCEALLIDEHTSIIYKGHRDLESNEWFTSGSPLFDSNGDFLGTSSSTPASLLGRQVFNPTVAGSGVENTVVIVWEDQTEPISQIWGSAWTGDDKELHAATQVTSQVSDCKRPAAGFVAERCVILFENDDNFLSSFYDSVSEVFVGTGTGGIDSDIDLGGINVANPAMPEVTVGKKFKFVYDFILDRTEGVVSTTEFPDFYLIGHADATQSISAVQIPGSPAVSNIDSKEFAFGDLSENVGLIAHWKDIKIYFGYDAIPHSVLSLNTNTALGWPDNRINDLFVDIFGNIIVATFGGLAYHNVFTGKLTNIDGHTASFVEGTPCVDQPDECLLFGKLITAVKWGGNGVWYVGTTEGAFYSKTAGRLWVALTSLLDRVVHSIAINKKGEAVFGTSTGIVVASPDNDPVVAIDPGVITGDPTPSIRIVAIDENEVIWAGTDIGLFRIENFSSVLKFNRNNGMRSSYITDIAIVNKYLRYVGTVTGIERMSGLKFTHFNVNTHALLNDNIARLTWIEETQSLWAASLYALHEIVFRDPVHDIIDDEIEQYTTLDLLTEEIYDKSLYFILDTDAIQPDEDNPLDITTESATVFINQNKITFGFTVSENDAIQFSTDLLVDDQVEIEISNKFLEFHEFKQTEIEKRIVGEKRVVITKLDKTVGKTASQLLLLSSGDKPALLLFAGESSLPFTTLLIDRDKPIGCLERLEILTRTKIRFRILAFDAQSGLDGYILSNFENFTSDGTMPLEFQPLQSSIVTHDISEGLNNIIDSLIFPGEVEIAGVTHTVGSGAALGTWVDQDFEGKIFLYAATSAPIIVFRFDPGDGTWTAIQAVDSSQADRTVTGMRTINNVLYMTTGRLGGAGRVFKMTDGLAFELVGGVTGANARGVAPGPDGTVFFGSSDGKIYALIENVFQTKYQNIGTNIFGLDSFQNLLVAATGDLGRIYLINTETSDNFIIFDGTETNINDVHIKDAGVVATPAEASLYASSGELTTIYRSDLDSLDFIKSYTSFGKETRKVKSVDDSVLKDIEEGGSSSGEGITVPVAIIGTDLFKHTMPSWEFIYRHEEEIFDFLQYESNGVDGIWVISDSKVTKRTNILSKKTVFLKLKDKAGNVSALPDLTVECPTEEVEICCNYAYSIDINDLKNFTNESRIIDVNEYGEITFTFDSPNDRNFYSADQIDQEVGIYDSEVFNGSNDLVSWKTITWESVEPSGTAVDVQIRTAKTEDDIEDEEWTPDLVKNSEGFVSIEHISDQYLQFRVILTSQLRGISPTLSSVTLRNLTAQASHFFTTNFVLPSRPIKGLITANTFIPVTADIIFGIETKNTSDFGDYQIIEPNRLFTTEQGQFGANIKIGAKILSPGVPQLQPTNNPGDPYDASSFVCTIDFTYDNIDSESHDFHFRARFYNDPFRTQLIHTFFSGNDQTGWQTGLGAVGIFPATGLTISSGGSSTISFTPLDMVETNQRWFIIIDAFDGSVFETVSDNMSFICSACNLVNEDGIQAEYYKTGLPTLTEIPEFQSFTQDFVFTETHLSFPVITDQEWTSTAGPTLTNYFQNYAIKFKGRLQAPIAGTYNFAIQSDDGSRLFLDANEVIDHDGVHAFTASTGSIDLTEGFHEIEVHYFNADNVAGLELRWTIPGESDEVIIPPERFFHAVATEYCDDEYTPKIFNLAMEFELEGGEHVQLNLR